MKPVTPPLTRQRAFWRQEWFLFLLFVAPNSFFFSVFSSWPIISNVALSMVRWDMIAPVKTLFGGAHFAYLAIYATFHTVLKNSVVFTIGAVGGSLILGWPPCRRSSRAHSGHRVWAWPSWPAPFSSRRVPGNTPAIRKNAYFY